MRLPQKGMGCYCPPRALRKESTHSLTAEGDRGGGDTLAGICDMIPGTKHAGK